MRPTDLSAADGYASVIVPMLFALASIATVAVLDVTAYFAAASRAQSLADAAALAAVAPEASNGPLRTGVGEAHRIAAAGGGRIEDCACRAAREHSRVTTSVEVPGLVIPRLGAGRVTAEAAAVLTRPGGAPTAPG